LDLSQDLSQFFPDLDLYLDLAFLTASLFSSPLNAAIEDPRTLYKKMLPSLNICLIGISLMDTCSSALLLSQHPVHP